MTEALTKQSDGSSPERSAGSGEAETILDREPAEAKIRAALAGGGVLSVRLMGPPGAGKTQLLEALLRRVPEPSRVAVIVVNPAAQRDAERLRPLCDHVQFIDASEPRARAIWQAIGRIPLKDIDLILIETCGGLAALEDLGQDVTVVALSVSGGDDKAVEYAGLLRVASDVVLTKIDLRPVVKFDDRVFSRDVQSINPAADFHEVSAYSGAGILGLLAWLNAKRLNKTARQATQSDRDNENFIG
jgi:hydrogenase nickel incorporation protein HypB